MLKTYFSFPEMSSIRFPTAALSGILNAPGAAPSVPQQQQQMGPGAQYYPQQNVPYRRSQGNTNSLCFTFRFRRNVGPLVYRQYWFWELYYYVYFVK